MQGALCICHTIQCIRTKLRFEEHPRCHTRISRRQCLNNRTVSVFFPFQGRSEKPHRFSPVLPSAQKQNMPNCVSEYAKEDKNIPNFFRKKNTWKIGNKIFHIFMKFTAESTNHIIFFYFVSF